MSNSLTIRNLPQAVKQKLRLFAASHGRSMEAEARAILAQAVETSPIQAPQSHDEKKERLSAMRGVWRERYEGKSTDEVLQELRGDD